MLVDTITKHRCKSIGLLLLTTLLLTPALCFPEMYKWVNDQGITQYSDVPPKNEATLEISGTISSYTTPSVETLPDDFFKHIKKPNRGKRVIMYSADWCGVCKRAKAYFQKKSIAFVEYDIDKSEKAKADFDKMGGAGVPVILVGKQRLNGFSQKRFEQLYYGKKTS